MNNSEVAQAYAEGKTKGRGSNMFIEGDIIYSYGYHFPLAIRTNVLHEGRMIYLINSDTYSVSTAKHKSHVSSALMGELCIHVNLSRNKTDVTLMTLELEKRIEDKTAKMNRSRIRKDRYQSQIEQIKRELSLLPYVVNYQSLS